MEMNNQLQNLLNALIRPGVEYNTQHMSFAGVSFFRNENGVVSGLLPAPSFIIEIENVGIEPQGDFFHYITNTWQSNPLPVSIEALMDRLKNRQFKGKIIYPFKNLVNFLNKMEDQYKKKCRVIISPNQLFSTDLLMKFTNENGTQVFRHPALPKPCVVASDSAIPSSVIDPITTYKGVIIEETSEAYMINVVAPYAKVQMGIHYSEHGFFPDNLELINRLTNIPQDFIMGTNTVDPVQNFEMPPIHLDCTLFYDLIRVFALIDAQFIEIYFGEDSNAPILLRNLKQGDRDIQINILMDTLNPFYGVQRR